ncbi:thioredoxin domain-containing protein [Croceicoccus sp. Ery5]|uniref:DsbA family protein n=1 Tax=Croceicoccus sp. Ery5 TaxID=1703340 RepID=UPI001E5C48AE|nr:thioredoxin domain-containing protein [Croceicoccus sp. Ery5]
MTMKTGLKILALAMAGAAALTAQSGTAGSAAAASGAAQSPQGVTRVEPGVHRIGPAKAPVTLTEYVSYTCPHCAHFEQEAGKELVIAYAATGKASVVVRHLVRDQADLAAALVTNCGQSDRFLANHSAIMSAQPVWLDRWYKATSAQRARYQTGTVGARMQAVARDLGFYDIMARRGYSKPQLDRCLADEALAKTLSEKTAAYLASGVSGTPSFDINGVLLAGTHDWASLKPQLDVRMK